MAAGGTGRPRIGRGPVMGWLCVARSVLYTLRYWLRTGDLTAVVSGHEYGEPTYRIEDGREYETLACRCGATSEAWR